MTDKYNYFKINFTVEEHYNERENVTLKHAAIIYMSGDKIHI